MHLVMLYEKNVIEKSASFVECLSSMALNGEEGSFLEYTTEWVSILNRRPIRSERHNIRILF